MLNSNAVFNTQKFLLNKLENDHINGSIATLDYNRAVSAVKNLGGGHDMHRYITAIKEMVANV